MIREHIAKAVGILALAWNREISEPMIETYAIALEDLEPHEVEEAALRALKTCEFWPVPAVLRRLVGKEDVATLHQPAAKCRSCGITLDFDESRQRGFCGDHWRPIMVARKARQVPAPDGQKQIGGGR